MVKLSTALAVGIILIILGIGMWYSFPFWDDAWLYLLVREHGSGAIKGSILDRPLVGILISSVWALGLLPTIILSLALWAVLGFLAARLLTTLFPSVEGYGPLCMVLTVSPVLTKCHLAIFNVTSTALIAVILGYLGLLVIRSYVRFGLERYLFLILGLVLFALGVSISEYAIPVALITLVLLIPYIGNKQSRRPPVKAIALLAGVTVLSYAFTAFRGRPNTSPLYPFQKSKGMLKNLPFTLVGSVWQSLIGAYAESLGYLSQLSLLNKPAILCMILGVVISLLLFGACCRIEAPKWNVLAIPLAALLIGILPLCLMYRIPYPNTATRFLLPMMPLASAMFVALLAKAFHDKFVPVILVGLICASAAGQLAYTSISQRRDMDRYSQALREDVAKSDHLVIAVLTAKGSEGSEESDYMLTGTIARDWPLELEKKFWAYSEDKAVQELGPRDHCRIESFTRDIRMVHRSSPVDKVIMVSEDGSTEPYCK